MAKRIATGMMRQGRALAAGALFLASAGFLSACAAPVVPLGLRPAEMPVSVSEGLMLDDLADVLEQLHAPRITTVQFTRGRGPLSEAFADRLANAGYGVQWVDADQGAFRVQLSAENDRVDGETVTQFEMTVGSTSLARSYATANPRAETLADARVRPVSALSVGGTRAPVVLDDTRFGDDIESRHTRVIRSGLVDAPTRRPLISLITEEVVAAVARDVTQGPSLAAVNSQRVEVPNLYYGNDAAFASLDNAYDTVESSVVIFANDSMRLGPDGKRSIERFIEGYAEDSDLIGLIGCSNGPTALDIGNEGLALGRSRRVAEELVTLGVAPERIVDEGCWAPTSARDRFPSRGVVMELLRKPS